MSSYAELWGKSLSTLKKWCKKGPSRDLGLVACLPIEQRRVIMEDVKPKTKDLILAILLVLAWAAFGLYLVESSINRERRGIDPAINR